MALAGNLNEPEQVDQKRKVGSVELKSIGGSCFPNPTKMGNQHSKLDRRLPKIKFRVLIIGRANAGKTSILQRVCDTSDSPVIYRLTGDENENEKVRGQAFL